MTSVAVRHSRPWQLQLAEYLRAKESVKIHVVDDSNQHMIRRWRILPEDIHHVATSVFTLDTIEDLAARAEEAQNKSAFLLDTRWTSLSPQEMRALYTGILCLKEGTLCCKQRTFQRIIVDSPAVVVWTNQWPDLSIMSEHLWAFHFMRGIDTMERIPWDKAQDMTAESRLPVLTIPRALAPLEQIP